MHVCEANSRRHFSQYSPGNAQLFERFGVQEKQGNKLPTAPPSSLIMCRLGRGAAHSLASGKRVAVHL